MTHIEQSALELINFLNRNTAPSEAWEEGMEADWPVDICIDNDKDADEFCNIMNKLEDDFKASGIKLDKPYCNEITN